MEEIKKNTRLKQLRQNKKLTLSALSEMVGVSDATLQRYESGQIQSIKKPILEKLAEIFGCTQAYIMGWGDESTDNIFVPSLKKLPVLGEISCGQPVFCHEGNEDEAVIVADSKADFCLVAKGDSMTGVRIYEGDIVFIKEQDDVENGEIAAVIIDDEATLKRVFKKGGVITLMSENPKYDPLVYTPDEFTRIRILGKAVGMQTNNLL